MDNPISDELIRSICLNPTTRPQPKIVSVKLSGDFALLHKFLKQQGYTNTSRQLKLGLKLLAVLVDLDRSGEPVCLSSGTPILEALLLAPQKTRRSTKK